MRRCFVANQKLYISIDKSWRIRIPKMFTYPDDCRIYNFHYIGDNKIYLTAVRDSSFVNPDKRLYVPEDIKRIMNLQIDDVFEVIHYENGYILERVNKEDIE